MYLLKVDFQTNYAFCLFQFAIKVKFRYTFCLFRDYLEILEKFRFFKVEKASAWIAKFNSH